MVSHASTHRRDLPGYDGVLRAYHASHRDLLRRILEELPDVRAGRILDVACGDGFYVRLLAERFPPPGEVIGIDVSPAYVDQARRSLRSAPCDEAVRIIQANAYELPFEAESADLVWCAQSMITLEDPVRMLREMRRALKPDGVVAILENNQLHYVLLPWPPSLEIAVAGAQFASRQARRGGGADNDFARVSLRMFREAGLTPLWKRTYASDFLGPQEGDALGFVQEYFRSLEPEVKRCLEPSAADRWRELTDPGSPQYLPRQADFEMTSLTVVATARKHVA